MSKDATIMAALKTRLETIRTTNGYASNIGGNVLIWPLSPISPASLPAIMVSDTDIDHDNGQVMGMSRNTMTVDIVVVLTGSASLSDARVARADLKKCLHGYETAGGLCNRLTLTKSKMEMKQFEEMIAGVTAQLLIEYDTARDAI